ncbi:MAG: oxidoreductase, partial [Actinobacteria bacterium]|nr:oxidoreductase [Actinomycetota bacterium]
MEGLRGKIALVTGAGRRRGIGSAICRALAYRGADVFFTYWGGYDRDVSGDFDEDEPEALREELRGMGVRAEGVELDLSLPESPEQLLDATSERL